MLTKQRHELILKLLEENGRESRRLQNMRQRS